MNHIQRIALIGLSIFVSEAVHADVSADLAEASAPLIEGVPEVAVVRLEALLSRNLPNPEWCAVAEKLAEAEVAAKEPDDALRLLADPRLPELPWAKFWRAEAFASLRRWGDALPLYEQLATDLGSSFQEAATFGAAEMLRPLGRRDEAIANLTPLLHDKEWAQHAAGSR